MPLPNKNEFCGSLNIEGWRRWRLWTCKNRQNGKTPNEKNLGDYYDLYV